MAAVMAAAVRRHRERLFAGTEISQARVARREMAVPHVRVDLHVHGKWSRDAIGDLDELARAATGKGLHGLVLTEHNTTAHHAGLREWNRQHPGGFVFYPGIEVSTRQGHLLAIGAREDVPRGLDVQETMDRVVAAGGVPVPAHPNRPWTGMGPVVLRRLAPGLRVVEVANAQEPERSDHRTADLVAELGLAGTGGSDAHQVHDVGNAYTILEGPVPDLDGLLDLLQRGRTRPQHGRTGWATRARQRARIAVRLVTRRYP